MPSGENQAIWQASASGNMAVEYGEYVTYLERLNHLIYVELVPKVAMLDYFSVHARKYEPPPEEVEPLLWFITSGVYYDVTLSLYRLFDNNNSDRNIHHFINVTSNELRIIPWKSPPSKSDVAKHRLDIESKRVLIDRLTSRRNKFFAHYDKKYFYDPNLISDDFPFSIEDAKELTRILQRIISFYHGALHGNWPLSLEGFVYVGAERIYDAMRESHLQRTKGKVTKTE